MSRFWRHLRTLWPAFTILAPLPFFAHAAWIESRREFHWENTLELALAVALFVTGPRTKKLFLGVYPIGLVGLLYSTMKVGENVGLSPSRVHLCDLRAREIALFGITLNGERGTVHDWLQAHATPALDLTCAVPYAAFMYVCIGFAVWLYFRDYARMVRFGWCFLALNVAGFVTYHVYPAAPPWYFHAHGCIVDLQARASEGPNLARVDGWLGIHYFAGMYGRASDVFGAMPSLHVAYALIVVLEGWDILSHPWRWASVGFYALMTFSAVYLDHHWILDAVAGSAYCVVVVALVRVVSQANSRRSLLGWTLATWFGCGRSPIAPGTMGTLGAIPLYILAAQGGRGVVFAVTLVVTAVGVWAAARVARELGNHDPQVVVIDEVAGMLVTMLPMPGASWRAIAVGFVVFRVLDAVKPWPIRWFERLPGGFGVVFDDLAAGAAGAAILAALRALEFLR